MLAEGSISGLPVLIICLYQTLLAVLRVLHFLKSNRAVAGAPYDAREETLLRRQQDWLQAFQEQPIVTELSKPKITSDILREQASGEEISGMVAAGRGGGGRSGEGARLCHLCQALPPD